MRWANTEVRRYADDIFLMRMLTSRDAEDHYDWNLATALLLPQIGTLHAEQLNDNLKLENTILQVRFRRGGESLSTSGGSRSLKNLFQEWRVPPWLRDRIPLIFSKNELVAVVGYYSSEKFFQEMGCVIRFETE